MSVEKKDLESFKKDILDAINSVEDRLQTQVNALKSSQPGGTTGSGDNKGALSAQIPNQGPHTEQSSASVDVQEEYRAISDSVSKVRLPVDQKLNNRGGVTANLRAHSNTITRCARYTETILKLIYGLKANEPVSELDIANLFTVANAEIKFLQDEYAALVAENKYGSDTASLFRDLQHNSSVFSEEKVATLKSAIELQGAANTAQNRQRGRGGFRGRRSFYGGYGNRGSNRGGYQSNNQDVFHRLNNTQDFKNDNE